MRRALAGLTTAGLIAAGTLSGLACSSSDPESSQAEQDTSLIVSRPRAELSELVVGTIICIDRDGHDDDETAEVLIVPHKVPEADTSILAGELVLTYFTEAFTAGGEANIILKEFGYYDNGDALVEEKGSVFIGPCS